MRLVPDSAVVLTAGLGTRFRPLSLIRAKAAVPLAGESLIRRILRWLGEYGVRNVVLNLHHRPETIVSEVGDGSDLGMQVQYSWEPAILGSAGGPRHALPLLTGETFLIVNGDTITEVDLRALADAHSRSDAIVTLGLSPEWDWMRYGGIALDEDGRVTGFVPRAASEQALHFVGIQLVHRTAFSNLPDWTLKDTFRDVYPRLIADRPGSVRGFVTGARFWDVGTPADYLTAGLALAGSAGFAEPPRGRSVVHPTSRLVDTILWDDVVVEEDCELTRCVVADRVTIAAGSRFADAAIVPAAGLRAASNEHVVGNLLIANIPRNLARHRSS